MPLYIDPLAQVLKALLLLKARLRSLLPVTLAVNLEVTA
jgi:hypothetical protein